MGKLKEQWYLSAAVQGSICYELRAGRTKMLGVYFKYLLVSVVVPAYLPLVVLDQLEIRWACILQSISKKRGQPKWKIVTLELDFGSATNMAQL